MTAHDIKNSLLHHYRFKRQFPFVATECLDSDILVSDGQKVIEIEIKISFADYRREFAKRKHQPESVGRRAERRNTFLAHSYDPNFMYFASPSDLANKILGDPMHYLLGHGVIAVDEDGQIKTLKKAQRLHTANASRNVLHYITMRMGSEMITLRQQLRSGFELDAVREAGNA